jgi:predicted AAA+ superfamily ATPase
MFQNRILEQAIDTYRKIFPIVAILGPRQCGKSTLVKKMFSGNDQSVYLDLQNLEDLNKLNDPLLFFRMNQTKTICLDEIQLVPELFGVLRSFVDENQQKGQFILLGSASRDLVQKSSESLAGRIGYLNLTPFLLNELPTISLQTFWNRGGFPDSVLAESDEFSLIWRENFIKTYIERDIPQLGFQIPALQLRRFLSICAHNHAQTLNYSKMGGFMDLTHPTIRKYIDLFEQTFILRTLQPFEINTKKRMVKSPKIYFRDQGLLHSLLGIKNLESLFGHPVIGSSWEGMVIEQVLSNVEWPAYFYRTATGEEMDLVLEKDGKRIAVECKVSTAPQLNKNFFKAKEIIRPEITYIVAPIASEPYFVKDDCIVLSLKDLLKKLKEKQA